MRLGNSKEINPHWGTKLTWFLSLWEPLNRNCIILHNSRSTESSGSLLISHLILAGQLLGEEVLSDNKINIATVLARDECGGHRWNRCLYVWVCGVGVAYAYKAHVQTTHAHKYLSLSYPYFPHPPQSFKTCL